MQPLIEHLMRGGDTGYYWFKQSKRTVWWATTEVPELPETPEDVYFGVHPSDVPKGPAERTLIADITAINCLYADLDSKDHTNGKGGAKAHVKTLNPRPSVIVDSGGGYHCYWLLNEPFVLNTDFKHEAAQSLQSRWVTFVGGDKSVHDLARVLRVPGTLNYKYDPPREVKIAAANYNKLYTLEQLEGVLPLQEPPKTEVTGVDATPNGDVYPEPKQPNDLSDQELVTRIGKSDQSAKFKRLWYGDNSEFDGDESAGDQSFCDVLAFWTGGDGKRIDSLFRASKRRRPKWNRDDYRVGTILKALRTVSNFYRPIDGLLTASADDGGNANCVKRFFGAKYLKVLDRGWCHYSGTHWEARRAEASLNRDIAGVLKKRRLAAWEKAGPEGLKTKVYLKAVYGATKGSTMLVNNCKSMLANYLEADIQSFNLPIDQLNCKNGILNLETGELTPHDPSQRYTYCLPVKYDKDADRSFWLQWLLEVVGGKTEVVEYLQEAVGYTLTGRTREEVAFYIFGPTRCGKGTFTEALLELLGAVLSREVGMEKFMVKRFGGGSDDFFLASLHGARFIAASETTSNKYFDASKFKRWTGGNPVQCAFKHKDHFTYRPQFKFWFSSNNPPKIDPDDEAGWGRIRVVHFPNSYVENIDKKLKAKMKSKEVLEGILAWAVEGSKAWYGRDKKGLTAPKVILQETQAARDAVNEILRWAKARLIVTGRDSDRVPYTGAFNDYKLWCDEEGLGARPKKYWKKSLLTHKIVTVIKNAAPKPGAAVSQCLHGVQASFYMNIKDTTLL